MVKAAVKGKLWKKELILPALALLTFTLAWAGAFPQGFVEKWFSRTVYPDISTAARMFADAATFAWRRFGFAGSIGLALRPRPMFFANCDRAAA